MRSMLKGPAVVIIAVIVLLASWWLILGRSTRSGSAGSSFFYDLQSNTLFTSDATELPPIVSPTGGEAVRAIVMSCGDCADKSTRFIAYLEKYDDAYKQAVKRGDTIEPQVVNRSRLVRAESAGEWAPGMPAVNAMREVAAARCGSAKPSPCMP